MFKQTTSITTATVLAVAVLAIAGAIVVVAAGVKNFFPAGALDPDSAQSDNFRSRHYSERLRAMSEPVLEPQKGQRAYRFIWLRTFHHPVAVRIVAAGGTFRLYAVELDGASGYAPGKVFRRISRNLSQSEFHDLEDLIQRSGFWQMPSRERTLGRDGSHWIIEAATDKYHVVDRWTPESGAVRELGEHFLSLVDWQYKDDEFY